MQPVGVLICGYDREDARTIKAFLDSALDSYVILASASGKTEMPIIDILRQKPAEEFVVAEPRVMILIGFSEVQTHMVLEGFPDPDTLKRPIFCTLTAQNRHWPLRELIEHLAEEHRRWTAKARDAAGA
jgi:hypothetical protein